MADDGTRAIIRDLYDAYGRRDFDRVAALIHDDVDWTIYAPVQLFPFAGQRQGRAAVLQALGGIAELYVLESYTPEIMIADGDNAAVMSDVSLTQRSTGRKMRFRVANFLRIQDGKVIEFREFMNTFDVAEQELGRELQL